MGIRDEVDHPRHYMRADIGRECIEFNRDMPYCMGNAFKYAYRAGLKGSPVSDWGKCLKSHVAAGVMGAVRLGSPVVEEALHSPA